MEEIQDAIKDIEYGSLEIYIAKGKITQITKRVIQKVSINLIPDQNKFPEEFEDSQTTQQVNIVKTSETIKIGITR